jgi:hypothetical protein
LIAVGLVVIGCSAGGKTPIDARPDGNGPDTPGDGGVDLEADGDGPPVGVLTVSPANPHRLKGSALQFTALLDSGGGPSPIQATQWSSSNPEVATVDGQGNATLLAPGTSTITASISGSQVLSASTVLTVAIAAAPVFSTQPSDTNVGAVIGAATGVRVQLLDNLGGALPGQTITIAIGANGAQGNAPPATGVLSGTLSQATDAGGTATFQDLKIDWLGQGYTLVAAASPVSGAVSAASAPFNELRAGDSCTGPNPACSSGCPDADGDGLNDAWESAGGIDLNGDDLITDAAHDVLLPGADPGKPDIYVKYDYMVATGTSSTGRPPHTHQPPAAAIQQVVDAFASHGVNLRIDPQHDAIPEVLVTTLDPNPAPACAGPEFVTMATLRQQYLGNLKWAYHYGVFAHNATTPDNTIAYQSCPRDPECGGLPDPTSSGSSDRPGQSFIVAFGYDSDNGVPSGVEVQAGTFMHELGHNFGLQHGYLAAPAPQACLTSKPNYISVMGYSYQGGIAVASAPGSTNLISCNVDGDCPSGTHCTDDLGAGGNVCYRVDYSREKLLDLNEASLDEPFGVGGGARDTDIVQYLACGVTGTLPGPAYGAIDWNNDGNATETAAMGDIDGDNPSCAAAPSYTTLQTGNDWQTSNGMFTNLNFRFQCTAAFASESGGGSVATSELGWRYAREHHLLHPPAAPSLALNPGCSNGGVQMALLGSSTFDVRPVEPSSLTSHGAHPNSVTIEDVNRDGIPDLLLEFTAAEMRVSKQPTHVRLTGWLKNSRSFIAEAPWSSGCSR